MLRALAGLVFLGVAAASWAADTAPQQALAQQYFKVSGMDSMYADKKQLANAIDMQLAGMEKSFAQQMPPEKVAEFHQVMEKMKPTLHASTAKAVDKMRPVLVKLVAERYSEAELKALIAFYNSPEGKSVVAKNPKVMAEIMHITGEYMGAAMQDMQKDLMQALQESAAAGKKAPAAK